MVSFQFITVDEEELDGVTVHEPKQGRANLIERIRRPA
jgi:hypothetical protein